jgi:hypothetical protein
MGTRGTAAAAVVETDSARVDIAERRNLIIACWDGEEGGERFAFLFLGWSMSQFSGVNIGQVRRVT